MVIVVITSSSSTGSGVESSSLEHEKINADAKIAVDKNLIVFSCLNLKINN